MKMKNMMKVSGNPQSTFRNALRSANRNTPKTTTHITQIGTRSLTTSRHSRNNTAYTHTRQPPWPAP